MTSRIDIISSGADNEQLAESGFEQMFGSDARISTTHQGGEGRLTFGQLQPALGRNVGRVGPVGDEAAIAIDQPRQRLVGGEAGTGMRMRWLSSSAVREASDIAPAAAAPDKRRSRRFNGSCI